MGTHRLDPIPRLRPILPAIPVRATCPEAPNFATIGVSNDSPVLNDSGTSCARASVPSILGIGLRYSTERLFPAPNNGSSTRPSTEDFNHAWPQNQTHLTNYRLPSTRGSGSCLERTTDSQPNWDYFARVIEALCTFIPPSVDSTKETYFVHIIHEYQLQRTSCCFMAPPTSVRDPLINRLVGSKATMWAIYLGVKLFQVLDQDSCGTNIRGHIGWIDKFEQKFDISFNNSSSSNDAADWLFAQLELVYLSFVMVDSLSGYDLLRKALPKFLRLVTVDPKLSVEHTSGNLVVSFPRAFGSLQHELKRFIFYDTNAALVLGVPPLVEYGYDGKCDPISHGFEWVHGVPIPLVETISQVNSWRAGSRDAPLDDWRNLERRVLAWEPQPVIVEGEDSATGSVARLAVQEGWRHVALIYIYMGMCGVSSHDSRVQTSISQIVQLGETVANLSISLHMFTHYVVVSLGARYEKHRSIIREKLLLFKNKRVWLFRGPEFSRVLDHLWHGVGAGGAPVVWDDYVRSRCTVLPL
ncbi:putative fungal zn(2)-cys(6) binuclear cluster domain protein [Rhizoctonia solani 123E]|uniref:Putative fungal zn(2)-cys(6) binuclear cluster domain protein n=1 Tax=Rhizoctonia solani 123E TaxID=1423351 RepID=A0A074S1Y4_9AGAM|nr:putative fungal zn(2)-cys(6) binuclear cluster domain protein [Rhizoctonia solani 123E]